MSRNHYHLVGQTFRSKDQFNLHWTGACRRYAAAKNTHRLMRWLKTGAICCCCCWCCRSRRYYLTTWSSPTIHCVLQPVIAQVTLPSDSEQTPHRQTDREDTNTITNQSVCWKARRTETPIDEDDLPLICSDSRWSWARQRGGRASERGFGVQLRGSDFSLVFAHSNICLPEQIVCERGREREWWKVHISLWLRVRHWRCEPCMFRREKDGQRRYSYWAETERLGNPE